MVSSAQPPPSVGLNDLFALPSGREMLPLLAAFAPLQHRRLPAESCGSAGQRIHPESGVHEARVCLTWHLPDRPRASVSVAVEAWEADAGNDGLSQLMKDVVRALGPEGLRIFYGILMLLHDDFHNGILVVDTDRLLDALGYERRKEHGRSYHHSANVARVRSVLRLLTSLTLQMTYRSNGRREHYNFRLFTQWASREVYESSAPADWSSESDPDMAELREPIREEAVIAPNPLWYDGVRQGRGRGNSHRRQFSWQLRRLVREDAREHGGSLVLGGLLPLKFRMTGGSPVKVSLRNLLAWAGLRACGPHRYETMKKLLGELDHMVDQGYVRGWEVTRSAKDPLDQIIRIQPPAWLQQKLGEIPGHQDAPPPRSSEQQGDALTHQMSAGGVHRLREEAGLSVRQFALQLGVSASLVSQLERGDRPLTPSVAGKISEWRARQ